MGVALQRLKELWRGQLPLEVAFWHYAIFYGLIVNIVATTAFFVLIVLDVPILVALIVHLVPVPYSFVAMCGVWRSADRYAGRRNFATFTRIGAVAWFCFWLAF
jgi:hypothetical protein